MAYLYPNQKSLSIGGRTFNETEVNRLYSGSSAAGGGVILYGAVTTADRYATLRKQDGTAFQVAASTKLVIHACQYWAGVSASFTGIKPLYGDDNVNFDSSAAPTNPIRVANYATDAVYLGVASGATANGTAGTGLAFPLHFEVPASKYPACQSNTADTYAIFYCLIEAV